MLRGGWDGDPLSREQRVSGQREGARISDRLTWKAHFEPLRSNLAAAYAHLGINVLSCSGPSGTDPYHDNSNLPPCALRSDGTITCWGYNRFGRTDAPAGAFIAVSAGRDHVCGLRSDNTVTCWGLHPSDAAGPPDGTFTAVTAGDDASCGLRADQTVECWLSLPRGVRPADVKYEARKPPRRR